MNRKRQYAGPRERAGVMKLITTRRGAFPSGASRSLKGVTGVFVPAPLDRDGRKALRHLFTRLSLSWEVAESFGDACPGRGPTPFAKATAFVVRAELANVRALDELARHRYCRSMSYDVVRPDRGGYDGTRLGWKDGKRPTVVVGNGPVSFADPRETEAAFLSRWERACGWAESDYAGEDDDVIDYAASEYCDMLAMVATMPQDLGR